jgi:hypothetical protein
MVGYVLGREFNFMELRIIQICLISINYTDVLISRAKLWLNWSCSRDLGLSFNLRENYNLPPQS